MRLGALVRVLWVITGALVCASGCSGVIGEDAEGAAGFGSVNGDGTPGGAGVGAEAEVGPLSELPAPATRFARLTHAQWNNTVRELFGLPDDMDFTTGLRGDPPVGGFVFDNPGGQLVVDQALWGGYQRAVAEIAIYATDPARLPSLVAAAGDDATRRDAFLADFGRRVHRRPLTDAELGEYRALFMAAPSLYEGLGGITAGVRLVIEAALQSPSFIYRVELSDTPDGEVIPLDGYEVASRLSYLLWNSMPDEALFAAADGGALLTVVGARDEALRMLEDPRAAEVVVGFHSQLLDAYRYDAITAAPEFMLSPQLPAHATEETERFVRDIIFGGGQGLRALLTSTETFVNAELAAIYGLQGNFTDDEWQRVTLDGQQRAGVLTQVGFLAANATLRDPDPIHRGKFVAERLNCLHINAPPADIPPLPDPNGLTNRELIAQHTENPATVCATCHANVINPFGFPFESYDAVGSYRTLDRGQPVDTTASPLIDGEPTEVADALELAQAMADSPQVHDCYAKHWIEFAHGRPAADEDEGLRVRLAEQSIGEEGGDVRSLIVSLVETRAFLTRSLQEAP